MTVPLSPPTRAHDRIPGHAPSSQPGAASGEAGLRTVRGVPPGAGRLDARKYDARKKRRTRRDNRLRPRRERGDQVRSTMEERALGATGLVVSRIGLGLAALGRPGYIN